MHGEINVDSKAIVFLIIGFGVMVLIVSSALGAPADESFHAFSVPPAKALFVDTSTRVNDGDHSACPAGTDFETTVQPLNQARCTTAEKNTTKGFGGRCHGAFIQDCVGDFPPTGSLITASALEGWSARFSACRRNWCGRPLR